MTLTACEICQSGHVLVTSQPQICQGGHRLVTPWLQICQGGHRLVTPWPQICQAGHVLVTPWPQVISVIVAEAPTAKDIPNLTTSDSQVCYHE